MMKYVVNISYNHFEFPEDQAEQALNFARKALETYKKDDAKDRISISISLVKENITEEEG